MATTNINVRVDSVLKQEAENLFNDLGINMSSAINMLLRSSVNYDGIPFEVRRLPNKETKAALEEYREMKMWELISKYTNEPLEYIYQLVQI